MTMDLEHFVDEMDSSLGTLTIVTTESGVCRICFGDIKTVSAALSVWLKKNGRKSDLTHSQETIEPIRKQLEEYFSGERLTFDLPLDLSGTIFQKRVWQALTEIEYGKTSSYKDVAERIGAPKAVRAVGGANNKNPLPIIIPCHRVIGSNGNMVGYGGGLDKKLILLNLESKYTDLHELKIMAK